MNCDTVQCMRDGKEKVGNRGTHVTLEGVLYSIFKKRGAIIFY